MYLDALFPAKRGESTQPAIDLGQMTASWELYSVCLDVDHAKLPSLTRRIVSARAGIARIDRPFIYVEQLWNLKKRGI